MTPGAGRPDAGGAAGERGAAGSETPPLPLAGYTVVSVEQAVSAPLATRLLADWGARVIKVERVAGGDFARHYDGHVRGLSTHFVWVNRSKESIALDLTRPPGLELLRKLIARADVFVQNLGPGAAARLGLSAADLRASDERLIVADISGYGSEGPYRERKAYDMLVQAEAGLVSITGTPEQGVKSGIPAADIAAGYTAAQAILVALLDRERRGAGAALEISMFDALVEWMGHPLLAARHGGVELPRTGLAHATIAPYDRYPAADGEVLIGVQNERQWVQLTEVLGCPELAADPRFTSNARRKAAQADLDRELSAATCRFRAADLVERLIDAGIPVAQVNTVRQVAAHPQLEERDRWASVASPVGDVDVLRPPVIGDARPRMGAVPGLGQHTRGLLRELGVPDSRVDELIDDGTVG